MRSLRSSSVSPVPSSSAVSPGAAGLIVLLAGGLTVSGTRPRPRPPVAEDPVRRRPHGAQVVGLVTAAVTLAGAVAAGRHPADGRRLALALMGVAAVAVLGAVAVLLPWLVDVVAGRRPWAGGGDPRRVGRLVGPAAGVLTAVLTLQAVADLSGDGLTGARADLVATARTGLWVAAGLTGLLLVTGVLSAAERRNEPLPPAALLVPTLLGVALAGPVAAGLTWVVGRATDLEITLPPVATAGWILGALLAVALVAAAGRPSRTGHRTTT